MQSSLTILGSVCNFFLFTYMIRFLINGIQSKKKFSRNLVSYYTNKNISVSYLRAKKKNDLDRITRCA